jgi:hypothetical protein
MIMEFGFKLGLLGERWWDLVSNLKLKFDYCVLVYGRDVRSSDSENS